MRQLTTQEIDQVTGGFDIQISGYEAAGGILAVVAFGSLFTPIGPITATIAVSAAGGIAAADAIARIKK